MSTGVKKSGPVEDLAQWLHEMYLDYPRDKRPDSKWAKISADCRNKYRHIARALLLRPPPSLLENLPPTPARGVE